MKLFTKDFYENIWSGIKSSFIGLKLLGEALALIVVSGYAIWAAFNAPMNIWLQRALLGAAALIVLRGSVEFMRHLKRLGEPSAQSRKTR